MGNTDVRFELQQALALWDLEFCESVKQGRTDSKQS
jgi:hypothetical protein